MAAVLPPGGLLPFSMETGILKKQRRAKESHMKKFFRALIKGSCIAALTLAAVLGTACAAGFFEQFRSEILTSSVEVPHARVIVPQSALENEEKAEGEEAKEEEKTEGTEEAEETGEAGGTGQAENGEDKETVSLLFAGDLFLTDLLQDKYRQKGIEAAASAELLDVTKDADIFMLNQEFPFGTTGEAAEDKQYTFRIAPSYVSVLNELGADIVTLANNHMLDFGRGPLTETLELLDREGISHVGAGENLEEAKRLQTFREGDKTIGILGATRVIPEYSWTASSHSSGLFSTYDPTLLLEEIKKAKESCDFVVVYVHWGIEKSTEPEEYQRTLAHQYIDAGADAVIGAHPHVLQGVEYYSGKPVFYSLGNFIFSNSSYQTMLVRLLLQEEGIAIEAVPCVSEANQMRLLEPEKRQDFYRELEALSENAAVDEDGRITEKE